MVANELEAADDFTDGEEAKALGEDDATSNELGVAEAGNVAGGLLAGGLDGLGNAVGNLVGLTDALPGGLVEGLEGGGGGRVHLLAPENNPRNFGNDLGVVDDEGNLLLNEANDLARPSANLAQGAGNTLCRARDGRAGGTGDAREALRSLARGILGGLGGLFRRRGLESGGSEGGSAHGGADGRAGEHFVDCVGKEGLRDERRTEIKNRKMKESRGYTN